MNFVFEQVRVGGDRNLAYIVGDRASKVAALVDPSYDPELLVERVLKQGMRVKYIINTHGHSDHISGNEIAQKLTQAKIVAYQNSAIAPDIRLEDENTLRIGSIILKVIWTPGHSLDHMVLYLPDYAAALTGDHLFVGKVGGTVTEEAAEQQFRSLQRICHELPANTTIWPGHDVGCRPSSTMAWERATNPFLLARDFPAFLHLKISWHTYKLEQGLL